MNENATPTSSSPILIGYFIVEDSLIRSILYWIERAISPASPSLSTGSYSVIQYMYVVYVWGGAINQSLIFSGGN